jgi:hypothetical protein
MRTNNVSFIFLLVYVLRAHSGAVAVAQLVEALRF